MRYKKPITEKLKNNRDYGTNEITDITKQFLMFPKKIIFMNFQNKENRL